MSLSCGWVCGLILHRALTMAPVGVTGMLSWVSTPEVGIASLVVFIILSIALLALCAQCTR